MGAFHRYTMTAKRTRDIAIRFRRVMARYRDGRKRLWATELSLPASRGREESRSELQTTDSGMARFLSESYAGFAKTRRDRRIGVSRVFWYTWASPYCCGEIFSYTGLFDYDGARLRARPAHRAYVRSARRYEGCVKTASGTCR